MRKTDKKLDNQLRLALTDVCESALEDIAGFQWLTHLVNYSNFPKSFRVVCVFDTNQNLSNFMGADDRHKLSSAIQLALFNIDIHLKNIGSHLSYDTEENCNKKHNGKWSDRLK